MSAELETYGVMIAGWEAYEGWVAYVDGHPVLEAVPHHAGYAAPARHAKMLAQRATSRNVMDWKNLPHPKVHRVELYFARGKFAQPLLRIDRQPGNDHMRFIQFKRGGIAIGALAGNQFDEESDVGQRRLLEATMEGLKDLGTRIDPFLDPPIGHGLPREAVPSI